MKTTLMALFFVAGISGTTALQASPVTFSAVLNGASQFPANTSPGTGIASVDFDLASHVMTVRIDFSDLLAGTTVAHIHCCTPVANAGNAPVATTTPTFPGFPAGVTEGIYNYTFDMRLPASYNPAFLTAYSGIPEDAEAALYTGMAAGQAYVNVHSALYPAGEIRGFLQVPEPGSLALLGVGLAGLAFSLRTRQSRAIS